MNTIKNGLYTTALIGLSALGCKSDNNPPSAHQIEVATAMREANERCDMFAHVILDYYLMTEGLRSFQENCTRRNRARISYVCYVCDGLKPYLEVTDEAIAYIWDESDRTSRECRLRLRREISSAIRRNVSDTLFNGSILRYIRDNQIRTSRTCGQRSTTDIYSRIIAPEYNTVNVLLQQQSVPDCPNSEILFTDPVTNSPQIDGSDRYDCYLPRAHNE